MVQKNVAGRATSRTCGWRGSEISFGGKGITRISPPWKS
jgi:hypothetical protein